MLLISQATFATKFYEEYCKISKDPSKHIKSIVVDAVNQLIYDNKGTIINQANGKEIPKEAVTSPPATTMAQVDAFFNNQPAVSTNVVVVGEAHTDARDIARAQGMLGTIDNAALPTPGYIVFERGLPYPAVNNSEMIRELNLTTGVGFPATFYEGLFPEDRSYIVAGYLVARAACGNQISKNNIMLFFGALHEDILTFFEHITRQCGSADHLLKVPRNYNFIRSYTP